MEAHSQLVVSIGLIEGFSAQKQKNRALFLNCRTHFYQSESESSNSTTSLETLLDVVWLLAAIFWARARS